MTALHVFDMDGTLLTGTTASLQVAAALGDVDALVALEGRFAAGELTTVGFAAELCRLWRDLDAALVARAFAGSPWLTGIEQVCADIRRRGEHSAVVTMSPDFFAVHLLQLGFDEVVASRLPPLPLTAAAMDPAAILTPRDKVRIVEGLREKYGVARDRCVAYGDSLSDAPLFRELTATVAVNADHHLADLAAVDYHGDSLLGAYELGRRLLPE